MTDAARRAYLGLGRAFVAIGAIVAVASLLDRALGWGFFSGSPLGTAAFLALIGVLLLRTVASSDAESPPEPVSTEARVYDGDTEAAGGAAGGEPPEASHERP